MQAKPDRDRYKMLFEHLRYAVHELPTGVLYGANGANKRQCAEWMQELLVFEQLSEQFNIDNRTFIEGCRWHFEHYPHYLGRQRHFASYEQYTAERNGPLTVF